MAVMMAVRLMAGGFLAGGILREEGVTLGCREVPGFGPGSGEGKPREAALFAAEEAQRQGGCTGGGAVEGGAFGKPGPKGDAITLGGRGEVALVLTFAPVTHEVGQGDFDRADALAFAAKGAGVGQVPGGVDAGEHGGEHRAHGAGVDGAVSVAADGAVDRAVVHAGGAADAAEHVLELGADHGGAAVVQQRPRPSATFSPREKERDSLPSPLGRGWRPCAAG